MVHSTVEVQLHGCVGINVTKLNQFKLAISFKRYRTHKGNAIIMNQRITSAITLSVTLLIIIIIVINFSKISVLQNSVCHFMILIRFV